MELIEDVEVHPVDTKFLPLITSSYEETIQLLLKNSNTTGLALQAMHELGNIHFSRGNTKVIVVNCNFRCPRHLIVTSVMRESNPQKYQ